MTLGHRVAVLKDGRLQQCDVPRALYERPANTFVAGFIGSPSMNLLEVPRGEQGCSFCGIEVPLPSGLPTTNGSVVLGLRPEALDLAPGGIEARVEVVEEFGADSYVFCVAEYGGEQVKLVARTDSRSAPEREARVSLCPRVNEAHVFDAETGARLELRCVSLDVATPAAVVDLDRLEANLARWQAHCDEHGLANRPHVKTHKCVEIARRQVELGARGVTVQTLFEAEVMVERRDRRPAPPVQPRRRAEARAARAAAPARLGRGVGRRRGAAARARRRGHGRGPRAGRCSSTATRASGGPASPRPMRRRSSPPRSRGPTGCASGGLVTYPAPPGSLAFLTAASELIERRGLPIETVSVGGTPTMWDSGELRPVVNEYRVGTYVFNDRNTVASGAATLDDVALTIVATVVSRRDGRAILDAGSKALSSDAAVGGRLRRRSGGALLTTGAAERGARLPRARRRRRPRARPAGAHRPEPRLRRRQPLRRADRREAGAGRASLAGRARPLSAGVRAGTGSRLTRSC